MKDYSKNRFSFLKGYEQVPLGKAKEVQDKIMNVLEVTTNQNWLRRLRGLVEPKVTEKEKIEQVFKSYNITKIWGNGK